MISYSNVPMPSIQERVREMTEYAKSVPESRIHSNEQLTNLVYDIVKKTPECSHVEYYTFGQKNEMEKISNEITHLYYNTH